jgi:hypothetical protein
LSSPWIQAQSGATNAPGFTAEAGPNTRSSSSTSESVSASDASIPLARTARRYLETAPVDSPSARASARTLKLLDCSPISCFSFDMEILSFGIDRAPRGKNPRDYPVYLPINLQPPTSRATIVNTLPRS